MNNSFIFSFKTFFYLGVSATIIFLVSSFFIVTSFFYQKSYEFKLEYIHKNSKLNNIIIGDSQFAYGLQLSGFENISYPSLSLKDSLNHMNGYFSKRKAEIIIFQITPAFLSSSRFNAKPILVPSSDIQTRFKMYYFQEFKYMYRYWKLFIKTKVLNKPLENKIDNVKFEKWIDLSLNERKKIVTKRVVIHKPQYKIYNLVISDMIDVIKKIKTENNELLFCLVVPPYTNDYLEAFSKISNFQKFSDYLFDLSKENGFKYGNFAYMFTEKQHLFADQEHLNNLGRNLFSKRIQNFCN